MDSNVRENIDALADVKALLETMKAEHQTEARQILERASQADWAEYCLTREEDFNDALNIIKDILDFFNKFELLAGIQSLEREAFAPLELRERYETLDAGLDAFRLLRYTFRAKLARNELEFNPLFIKDLRAVMNFLTVLKNDLLREMALKGA